MDLTTFQQLLQRPVDSHKFDFGHVLVLGGSAGMTGAAILAGHAALRTGAGLVTIARNKDQALTSIANLPEIMTVTIDSVAALEQFITVRKVSVVAFGSGLQPSELALSLLQALLQSKVDLVIDGGGLTLLQSNQSLLLQRVCRSIILTPHPGEFKRLINQDLPIERSKQTQLATNFAEQHDVVVVLKGPQTFVTAKGKLAYYNDTGNPGLATAGSGDVLSGVIAGMLAQGLDPLVAAQAGVYVHGLSGDIAARELTQPAVIASDIIGHIAAAYSQIRDRRP